jgi:chaperonin GroES
MNITPLHDWAVVRPTEAKEKSVGGIIIPDTAKEKPQEGEIIAIGKGRYKEEKTEKTTKTRTKEKSFIKTTLKPGDRILYEKYAGRKIDFDGQEFVMVREEDVLGQLTA